MYTHHTHGLMGLDVEMDTLVKADLVQISLQD